MSIVHVTIVPNLKVRELMVFSTKDRKLKKLELFKVPVLLVITGKPQTLACDISGTQGWKLDFIRFSTWSSLAALSHM